MEETMSDTVLVLIGFLIGALSVLGWMWWRFTKIEIAPLDDEDFEDWNGQGHL